MIPRLFGLDQIRAERIAFNKSVVMTTKRGTKSNGSTDFHEILLEYVFAAYDNPYCFCYWSDESWAYAIPINRSYGHGSRFKSPDLPQNILKHSLNSCGHVYKISELLINMQSLRRQLKIFKSLKIRVFWLFFRLTLLTRYRSNRLIDFMKFCINVCLLQVMIPIVFGYDQTKVKRMAFNKPVVMATDLGSQVLIQLKIPWNFLLIVLNMCAKFQNFW